MSLSSFIFGNPLKTENLESERLPKSKALAVISSDIMSSVAYATEEILLALGAALAASFSLQIAAFIVGLIAIVATSYWQTIEAYPKGGGAFTVAYENFGESPGLIAASALLIDFVLTVTVSLCSGASALISAFPILTGCEVKIGVCGLILLTISNLRGTGESATMLMIPSYGFMICMFVMVIGGLFKAPPEVAQTVAAAASGTSETVPTLAQNLTRSATVLVVLRAFASGCCAMTGIESIANGVAIFQKPQYRNAQITLAFMATFLASIFAGITFLTYKFGIVFSPTETVVSQIASTVFGKGFVYYVIQLSTAVILLFAANSAFASFPRLASILGQKKYLPTRFANLGDRLAYSNGIVMLSIVATTLIYVFDGNSHALIPLYAIGVFTSFTLSQAGMVKRNIELKARNWQLKVLLSAFGALATLITLLILFESKFLEGSWIVAILITFLFTMFRKTNRRYHKTNIELDLKKGGIGGLLKPIKEFKPKVVVPVSRIHKGTLSALRFAASLSDDVVAVIVDVNQTETERLKLNWRAMNFKIPLIILSSPYRSIMNPFLEFLTEIDEREPEKGEAVVIMPSFVPGKFWQNILHNQTAAILKTSLLYKKRASEQTRIIVEIPYQMKLG